MSSKCVRRCRVALRSCRTAAQSRAVRQLARGLQLPGHLDEELQRGLGVGGDAVVRGEDLADLGGLDVDVDELAARAV